MIYSTLVGSNLPEYGVFTLGMVKYTGIWCIQPWWGQIYWNVVYSTMVRLNIPKCGIFRYIRPYHGRINHIPVYSTLPWWNIPHSGIFDLTMVEYTTFQCIRPCRNMVYSTLVRLNILEYVYSTMVRSYLGIQFQLKFAQKAGNSISKVLVSKIFWGWMPPDPLRGAAVWLKLLHQLAKMLDPPLSNIPLLM